MATPITVIGSYISPYVRKVLVSLHLKELDYQIDPIVPFFGNEEFERISPLRRIPVLIDDAITLTDSTVICEYLDDRYPAVPLLPPGVEDRARARWLEEFADTRMGDVLIWKLFNNVVIRRAVWGETPDQALVAEATERDIPAILDYLESELPTEGYFFGEISRADIAVAALLRNATFARYQIDAAQWPRVAAFYARAMAEPAFARLQPFEVSCMKCPPAEHRATLAALGAPLSEQSWATAIPQRGIMRS